MMLSKRKKCSPMGQGLCTTDKASVAPMLMFDDPKPRSLNNVEKMIITWKLLHMGIGYANKALQILFLNSGTIVKIRKDGGGRKMESYEQKWNWHKTGPDLLPDILQIPVCES